MVLITQKKTQHDLNNPGYLFQNLDFFTNPVQPITPRIIINGKIGKINRSCLFGKIEWKTRKIRTGSTRSKFFFHALKKPTKRKILTGGISIPDKTMPGEPKDV